MGATANAGTLRGTVTAADSNVKEAPPPPGPEFPLRQRPEAEDGLELTFGAPSGAKDQNHHTLVALLSQAALVASGSAGPPGSADPPGMTGPNVGTGLQGMWVHPDGHSSPDTLDSR